MEQVTGQAPVAQPSLPESLNPHEAVGALAQMLEAEDTPQQARDEKGKFTKPVEAQPEAAAEKVEEPAKEEEAPEEEAQPEPRKLKIKYKGEDKDLLEPEVIELAQKGYDYTQKMQGLAKERDEMPAKIKAEVEARTNAYMQQLEVQKKAIAQLSGVKTMAEIEQLSKQDPALAQQEFLRAISVNQALAAIEGEQQKITSQKEAEARESFQKSAREAVEKLQEEIPGWNNDLYGKILKGAVDQYGFQQQDVNTITDPRAIKVLNDALKWREYQAAPKKVSEKKVPPVPPKVQKPGAGEKPEQADGFKKSVERLNQTGNRQDAQEAIRHLIETGRL